MRLKISQLRIFFISLLIILVSVIFFFSSQDYDHSVALSDIIAKAIHINQEKSDERISIQPILAGFSFRKITHLALYGFLGIVMKSILLEKKNSTFLAVVICYFFACIDEIHQSFVPGRTGYFSDTIIDLVGILLGVIICSFIFRFVKKRNKYMDKE